MFYWTSSSSERNLSSEKRVSSVWSKLPLNVRELFVELFFQNVFFSIQYGIWAKIYPALSKFSTKLSKTHFTCPREHFYKNILLTLWNSFRLWARKCRICGGTFAALLIKLLFCLQMGISKNSFEGNFTFSDVFRTFREHFLVFSMYHSRHGGPNWIPQAKMNISHTKNFVRKLFVFSGLRAHFFEQSLKSFRHVVKTSLLLQRSTVRKVIFFLRVFQTPFRTLSDNRPDLWRKVSATWPKLHFTCPRNFSIFFEVVCHVLFNFEFERKKS